MRNYCVLILILGFPFQIKAQKIPSPDNFGRTIFMLIKQNHFHQLPHHFVDKEEILAHTKKVFKENPEQLKQQKIDDMVAHWEERKKAYFEKFEKQFKRLDSTYLSEAILDSTTFSYRIISPEGEKNINYPKTKEYELLPDQINTSNLSLYFHINKVNFTLKMFIVYLDPWVLIPKAIALKSSAPGW